MQAENVDMDLIEIWSQIGTVAGEIYRDFSGLDDMTTAKDAVKKTGRSAPIVYMALGWLSREGNIKITRDSHGHVSFRILRPEEKF